MYTIYSKYSFEANGRRSWVEDKQYKRRGGALDGRWLACTNRGLSTLARYYADAARYDAYAVASYDADATGYDAVVARYDVDATRNGANAAR